MSRAAISYSDRAFAGRVFLGHDPEQPVEGYYRMRLRSGGVYVGVRIWHGAPLDPLTGEEMDRAHRWQATINGEPTNLERAWPKCADEPIGKGEHDYLASMQAWGRAHAPHSPQADPMRRINPLTAPTPF